MINDSRKLEVKKMEILKILLKRFPIGPEYLAQNPNPTIKDDFKTVKAKRINNLILFKMH